MIDESQLEVRFLDTKTEELSVLGGKDFADQIDKLKKVVNYMLEKMEKLGRYELSEFTASIGIELGAWIFKAEGGISMKWTKPSPKE